jgi:hypothetical protein
MTEPEPMNLPPRSSTSAEPICMPSKLKSPTPLEGLQSQSSSSSNSYPVTTSSSSFSSLMSNPLAARISFQTFTNLLPSWSTSRSLAGSCQVVPYSSSASQSQDHLSSMTDPAVFEKRGPRFVSKEKQLEKLRSRLEKKDINGDVSACNSCQDHALFV